MRGFRPATHRSRIAHDISTHLLRLGALLSALLLASCAGPQGGAVVGVRSPTLGEGSLLTDDVGIAIPGQGFAPILMRGCELPCKGSFNVRTSSENQERLRVRLLRRSAAEHGAVSTLVDFQIIDIPPAPAHEHTIEVTLRAKKDRLSIYAVEEESGEYLAIRTILFAGE